MRNLVIICFILLVSNIAMADSSYDRGKEKSVTCSACHGTDGKNDNKKYPRQAGQYKKYLIHVLNSYKRKKKKNAIMSGFAAGLSSQDIVDLSTYYSKQKGLNIIPKN